MMSDSGSLPDVWGSDMVKVFVGHKRKEYVLHKDLICAKSPFFNGMFKGSFSEAAAQECYLEEEEPEGFDQLVAYMYSAEPPFLFNPSKIIERTIKFYIVADKFLLPSSVKIEALNTIVMNPSSTHCFTGLTATGVNLALRATAEDCPLRQLVTDLLCKAYMRCFTRQEIPHPLRDDLRDECDAWLEECLDGVSPSSVVRMLRVLKDGRECWNESSEVAGSVRMATKCGVENTQRYKIGFLLPQGTELVVREKTNMDVRKYAEQMAVLSPAELIGAIG